MWNALATCKKSIFIISEEMQSMLDDDGTSNTDFNNIFSAAPATGFLKSLIYSIVKFSGYCVWGMLSQSNSNTHIT